MSTFWVRDNQTYDLFRQSGQTIPLSGTVTTLERLRRSIVYLQLEVYGVDAGVSDDMRAYGVLWGIEATTGSPPPEPPFLEAGPMEGRDFLWLARSMGRFVTGATATFPYIQFPGDGVAYHASTSVRRGDGSTPVATWLQWAMLPVPALATWSTRVATSLATLIETA